MSTTIRPITPDEVEPYLVADASAFGWEVTPEGIEQYRRGAEIDRTLATFEGEEIVGTAGAFTFQMTVPAGVLPAAGVTAVSVRPTHRRRGLLTAMMRRQLADCRDRGEAFAALYASESGIYGRFGYGCASDAAVVRIERAHSRLREPSCATGRTRFVTRDEALAAWPAVAARAAVNQPGAFARSQQWWEARTLRMPPRAQPGFTPPYLVQYEEGGEVSGYVIYQRSGSPGPLPGGTVLVNELQATSFAAYVALWEFVFGIDLADRVEAYRRPVDEPLRWLLADPRRLRQDVYDALWLRPLDVPAMLAGRRYSAEGRLVVEVRDEFCPWAAGRYLLEGGPAGARCTPTTAEPGLTFGAAELGAVYFGAVRFQSLAAVGLVEGSPPTLRLADAMFAWHPLPWCPDGF